MLCRALPRAGAPLCHPSIVGAGRPRRTRLGRARTARRRPRVPRLRFGHRTIRHGVQLTGEAARCARPPSRESRVRVSVLPQDLRGEESGRHERAPTPVRMRLHRAQVMRGHAGTAASRGEGCRRLAPGTAAPRKGRPAFARMEALRARRRLRSRARGAGCSGQRDREQRKRRPRLPRTSRAVMSRTPASQRRRRTPHKREKGNLGTDSRGLYMRRPCYYYCPFATQQPVTHDGHPGTHKLAPSASVKSGLA